MSVVITIMSKHFLLFFFLTFTYFTSLREQDEANINSSRWPTPVGLEPVYIRMSCPLYRCATGAHKMLSKHKSYRAL